MPDTVAQMTVANAIAAVRATTAHDNDQQTTDAQITAWLDREYRRVRRWITSFAPALYQTSTQFTLTTGQNTITKPVNFDSLRRLEKQWSQGFWQPLAVRPSLSAGEGIAGDVSGLYRLTYSARPVDGYSAFDLPDGAEDILIEMVSARVNNRHMDETAFNTGLVAELKRELRGTLSIRLGAHSRPMLQQQERGYYYGSFFEEGDHFVIV